MLIFHFVQLQPVVHDMNKVSEHTIANVAKGADGPWKEDGLTLKPCWQKPVLGKDGAFMNVLVFFCD